MASHDQSFLVTPEYSPEMGLGGYRDHSRKLKKLRTWDAGRRGATQRVLWTIQRAGCTDRTPLDGDVNYPRQENPSAWRQRMGRPESRPRLLPTRQFFRLGVTADKKRLRGAPGGEDAVDAGHADVELCRDICRQIPKLETETIWPC
jgi:hypothetical protein